LILEKKISFLERRGCRGNTLQKAIVQQIPATAVSAVQWQGDAGGLIV
jgi:hypothetical protein